MKRVCFIVAITMLLLLSACSSTKTDIIWLPNEYSELLIDEFRQERTPSTVSLSSIYFWNGDVRLLASWKSGETTVSIVPNAPSGLPYTISEKAMKLSDVEDFATTIDHWVKENLGEVEPYQLFYQSFSVEALEGSFSLSIGCPEATYSLSSKSLTTLSTLGQFEGYPGYGQAIISRLSEIPAGQHAQQLLVYIID